MTRRLLSAWVKPTFIHNDAASLNIEPGDLVCYVLLSRSTTDLLVTDAACELGGLPSAVGPIPELEEGRSVFFLGHAEGTFGRKTLRQQSARMTRLFDHQARLSTTLPEGELNGVIKIVPVSLFWGHQPDREKSIFKLLLSENWTATSSFKKFMAMLFHPNHILVQFGHPIALSELMASENDRARQIRKLLRLLRVHFNNERQAIIGPDLSHRRTLIDTMLTTDEVRSAIEREARTTNTEPAAIEKKALAYAREIASDQSYRVIRFFHVILTWLWNNLYDGISVSGITRLKELAQTHEIVYIPCHRSHIDYLLLSYVLYQNGLTPPHIAAGRNLNLPIIGPLLRRAGAFYMRRSFKGDALYKVIFDEYLHQMFIRGYSVEYFIEGGRSRTGRTLQPRAGMLSMTVRSFQRDSTKPIALMPVYFGYERVLESSTYRAELSGNDKKSESIFDVLKIFSSFKHKFGQVTTNFGEPLLLLEYLDDHLPDWQQPEAVSTNQFSHFCDQLANEMATRINNAVAINASSLFSVSLLSTSRERMTHRQLTVQIDKLRQLAQDYGTSVHTIVDTPAAQVLEEALEISGITSQAHQFGEIIAATPSQSINLTYNANNVLHVFALPSLICRYVRVHQTAQQEDINAFVATLYPYLKTEMFLAWPEEALTDAIQKTTSKLTELGLIELDSSTLSLKAPRPETIEYSCLQEISNISDPTLERFCIALSLLQRDTTTSLRQLETDSSGIAAQLSALYGINSPDFFEKSLFSTFLSTLKREQVIDHDLLPGEHLRRIETAIASTVDANVLYNIAQAVSSTQPESEVKTS